MTDLASGWSGAKNRLGALNTFKEVSQNANDLLQKAGDNFSQASADISSQLNKIKEQQKRFQRNTPTSMDQMLDMISGTKGNSSASLKYLRKKMLEALTKMEPKAKEIVSTNAMKALGCSQEQTYPGFTLPQINPISYIQNLPVNQGIYIPVKSIDFMGNLKIDPNSKIGKSYYEKPEPSTDSVFVPYGGREKYPFNKMLNYRMKSSNVNKNYSTEYGSFYNGSSQQFLIDINYTKQDSNGVSGDFFRVFLLDRNGADSSNLNYNTNKIKTFLNDYYSTIKIIDPVTITAALMNYISGCINISANFSYQRLSDDSKVELLLARIMGLCNDSRKEIDVSGVAKIPELDGVDDSFFEFTEIDLRKIEGRINNIQNGIVTFESCGSVNLPVNAETILDQIVEFSNSVSGNTSQQNVQAIENIIDTFAANPLWSPLIPKGVKVDIEINKNIIKDLPKAVASGILNPKVLLPIFVMLQIIEKTAKNTVNQTISSGNTVIQSANTSIQSGNSILQSGTTTGQQVNNVVEDAVDFFKKFKTFCIDTISAIKAEFLRVLFEILKKDILNLVNVIIADIQKSATLKKYTIILRLIQLTLIVVQLVGDYKKCKPLLNDIINLLNLINSSFGGGKIPTPLLFATKMLPGFSPERAAINVIEGLQKIGLPTGPMPDGSPNMMNQFLTTMIKGTDKEESENGTIDAVVIVPPLTGGLLTVFGKKR